MSDDLIRTGLRVSAATAFRMAGPSASDIDVTQIYDSAATRSGR